MAKKLAATLVFTGVVAIIAFWYLSAPKRLDPSIFAGIGKGDAKAGETLFWAGGCASCHGAKGAKGDEKLLVGGGHRLETPAGVFVTPNISPDQESGIGGWQLEDFANAMLAGISPDGSHYYPSFPYTSYVRMTPIDIANLWAYMQTLPPVARANEPHELALPFRLRHGIGLWKLIYLRKGPAHDIVENEALARGQYLVEGPGHCGECHTQRSLGGFGGMDTSRWLAGGPAPEGKGKIPNITPHESALGDWSAADIEYYLELGFTPDYDSVGGSMVSVQDNMSRLTKADRAAIAAYLKSIPPVAKQ